ncbi:MAG: hypothetical protein K0S93_281 [Nitrososphaeraceae archaeon]|jgi:hypothetical protein|nr:hypothetical protein [Nitrososphaeraceae archaeon]
MTDFTIWLPVALNPDKKKRDKYTRQIVQVIKEATFIAGDYAGGNIVKNNEGGNIAGGNMESVVRG